MKAFFIGLAFLVVTVSGAFVYLKYIYQSPPNSTTGSFKTSAITKTGELRKTNVAGSDFTHILLVPSEKSVGVASYTIHLDDYIGKKVSVTGQYSGDTLYADTVQELQ